MADVVALRGRRPLSVWVLCIVDGLIAIVLIATSLLAEDHGYSGWLAAFYGISGLLISIAAHMTWFGIRRGRVLLLAMLTLCLGAMIAYSGWVIAWAISADYYGPAVRNALLRTGFSLAWLALNYILLFAKRARMFFG